MNDTEDSSGCKPTNEPRPQTPTGTNRWISIVGFAVFGAIIGMIIGYNAGRSGEQDAADRYLTSVRGQLESRIEQAEVERDLYKELYTPVAAELKARDEADARQALVVDIANEVLRLMMEAGGP